MSYQVEKVRPYHSGTSKTEEVNRMFDRIAPGYDKLNGALSLGIDAYWRKEALKILKKYPHRHILDIATGTGDFALLAARMLHPKSIVAIDISEGMMQVGREKVRANGYEKVIRFERQDCAALNFPDNSFDAVTAAFGVRNFEAIDRSFREVLRVLKPGGLFLFLELTTPEKTPFKQLYSLYSRFVMPVISDRLATEKRAYHYLPESIAAFPQGREMMLILKKNGFTRIRLRRLTTGITTLYMAEKE